MAKTNHTFGHGLTYKWNYSLLRTSWNLPKDPLGSLDPTLWTTDLKNMKCGKFVKLHRFPTVFFFCYFLIHRVHMIWLVYFMLNKLQYRSVPYSWYCSLSCYSLIAWNSLVSSGISEKFQLKQAAWSAFRQTLNTAAFPVIGDVMMLCVTFVADQNHKQKLELVVVCLAFTEYYLLGKFIRWIHYNKIIL